MKRKGCCMILALCMALLCMPCAVSANTDPADEASGVSGYSRDNAVLETSADSTPSDPGTLSESGTPAENAPDTVGEQQMNSVQNAGDAIPGTVSENNEPSAQEPSGDAQEYDVRVLSAVVGLEDCINVKFFLSNPGEEKASNYTVYYIFLNKETAVKLNDCPPDEKGRFTVSVPVVAREMTEPIRIWAEDAGGKVVSNMVTYSVEDYCLKKLQNGSSEQKLKDVCAALLNYGACAQVLFGYNMENPANRGLAACGYSASVQGIAVPGSMAFIEGKTDGIAVNSATIGLEAATALHFLFQLDAGSSPDDYTFTCGDRTLEAVLYNADERILQVSIAGIAAKNMDKPYTVKVTKHGKGSLSVTCSVLTYLNSRQNMAENGMGSLCKAMYEYHVRAKNYFGE